MSNSTEQDKEQHIIAKPLNNPGRVAQGHKLAALMKKRKEEEQRNSSGDSSISSTVPSTVASTGSSTTAVLGGTAAVIFVIIGGFAVYYFKQHGIQQPDKSEQPVEIADRLAAQHEHRASKKVQQKLDIYKMH